MNTKRVDENSLILENKQGIPVRIFANKQLDIEKGAVAELEAMLELQETVDAVRETDPEFFDTNDPRIVEVAVTPDFHKGAGIPIGTVMRTRGFVCPQAPGKDVNCGMRLYTTDLDVDEVRRNLDALERRLRHLFFEGGRQIPMHRAQREALLRDGLVGVLATHRQTENAGLWRYYDARQQEQDLNRVNGQGRFQTDRVFGLEDFLGTEEVTRDSQIGSIGGGNHFVEVQMVERVEEGTTAYAWGLKRGAVVVMIHTGSVSIGHLTGTHFTDIVRKIHPATLRRPSNGLFPLPSGPRHRKSWDAFWASFSNAANFAYGNRLFLGLMVRQAFEEAMGEHEFRLLYDTGHNVIWQDPGEETFLHRKGACPARSVEEMAGTPFASFGEPVLIPGSMGASSYVLVGCGNPDSLASASHGAGRQLSRGEALGGSDKALEEFLRRFRIITPIDPRRHDIRSRPDILRKYHDELKKEAPWAYKDIGAVIQTHVGAGTARVVAELRPIFTVKG